MREATKDLHPSTADQESTTAQTLKSFDANGFTLGTDVQVNTSSENYVAWCLKAGGAPTTDNDNTSGAMDDGSVFKGGVVQSSYTPSGSPGTYPKKMSIADYGGFSIVEYVGTGGNTTIPHGLDRKPEFLIFKRTNTGASTIVWHSAISVNDTLSFTNTDGPSTQGSIFMQSTAPTATVVSLGSQGGQNGSSDTHILYSMAKTPGMIGIGSYTGNDSTNGAYVVVDDGASGFRPAWVMVKRLNDGYAWHIHNSVMSPHNPVAAGINANDTGTEATPTFSDFTANGFKLRTDGGGYNAPATYLYLAFAEHPFGGDTIAQGKAR